MIKTYFKIAWKNLKKNKFFSFINIFGLSVGLASCMLITLYIINEMSYDKYQQHGDDIYLIGTTFIQQGKENRTATTPAPMARAMMQDFPQVQQTARLIGLFAGQVKKLSGGKADMQLVNKILEQQLNKV